MNSDSKSGSARSAGSIPATRTIMPDYSDALEMDASPSVVQIPPLSANFYLIISHAVFDYRQGRNRCGCSRPPKMTGRQLNPQLGIRKNPWDSNLTRQQDKNDRLITKLLLCVFHNHFNSALKT